MFADALETVTPYTKMVLIPKVLRNGSIEIGSATFIVLNSDGWVLTAAHLFKEARMIELHEKEWEEYERKIAEINARRISNSEKKRQISRVPKNSKWIEEIKFLWFGDKAEEKQVFVDDGADVALVKLDAFDTAKISNYPIFKHPSDEFRPGTSLCRLGYPFVEIVATADSANKTISIERETQHPLFPLDGIYTRHLGLRHVDQITNIEREIRFVETSSPGLKGQSGGPIFDVTGHIWAIQSFTRSWPLGFAPIALHENKKVVEPQFLNAGYGPHVQEILRVLDERRVSYDLAPPSKPKEE
jgi:hypothetical protein